MRVIGLEGKLMGFINKQCVLCADAATRQYLWDLMVRYTLLVNELLQQVSQQTQFEQWQLQGYLTRKDVRTLCKPLRQESRFQGLPGRVYSSAELMVLYIYESWLALQKGRRLKIEGKRRWLEVIESDLELAKATDALPEQIRATATEVLARALAQLAAKDTSTPRSTSSKQKQDGASCDQGRSLLDPLFEFYDATQDPLERRAIIHLLKNGCQVMEEAEDPEALSRRLDRKKIQIERLEQQLKSQLPKGRDPTGERCRQNLQVAIGWPEHSPAGNITSEVEQWERGEPKRLAEVSQFYNRLPYPLIFGSQDDLYWSREPTKQLAKPASPNNQVNNDEPEATHKPKKRRSKSRKKQKQAQEQICVRFAGLAKYTFKLKCDRRQLSVFRQFTDDYQAFNALKKQNKFSQGLFLLSSACLFWQEDTNQHCSKSKSKLGANTLEDLATQSGTNYYQPWETHRLHLYCAVDPRRLTAEGTEQVHQQKLNQTWETLVKQAKKIKQTRKEDVGKQQEINIKRTATTLVRLHNPSPNRPSKLLYQGQSHIVVGVSFSRLKILEVVVVDLQTQQPLESQNVRQLLTDYNTTQPRAKRSVLKLRREKFRLVNRLRNLQEHNAARRTREQKQGVYQQDQSESNLGLYLDRLLGARIVELGLKWQASLIVLPDLKGIRENVESEVKARARHKYPDHAEVQQRYAKRYRSSFHQWNYRRLAQCIQERAAREGIKVGKVRQPMVGTLLEKAIYIALAQVL